MCEALKTYQITPLLYQIASQSPVMLTHISETWWPLLNAHQILSSISVLANIQDVNKVRKSQQ